MVIARKRMQAFNTLSPDKSLSTSPNVAKGQRSFPSGGPSVPRLITACGLDGICPQNLARPFLQVDREYGRIDPIVNLARNGYRKDIGSGKWVKMVSWQAGKSFRVEILMRNSNGRMFCSIPKREINSMENAMRL